MSAEQQRSSAHYRALESKHSANNYKPLDVVLTQGDGIWVTDVEGNRYMDFLSGYSALNHGHRHPRIIDAAHRQLDELTLTSRAYRNDQFGPFSQEITELTGFDKFLPMNSGAEAVETALKVARKWGEKVKGIEDGEIIVCSNNFHGRTITIVSFSSEDQYRDGFGPFTPGFKMVPFNDADAIAQAINEKTIGVLLEPIQGEGGVIIPEKGYLSKVAQLTRENGVLLMLDEIQTGLGRTGKLFAYEHEENAKPDVLIVGKALGGGVYPVSGILTSSEIMDVITPGDHGSTFGGNPLASAIGREALKVLTDENLVEKSRELGEYLVEKLGEIDSSLIKDIRGKGLFVGIELTPDSGGARKYCEELAEKGLLCKETHDMVIRLAPPLVVTREEIDQAVDILKGVLEDSTR